MTSLPSTLNAILLAPYSPGEVRVSINLLIFHKNRSRKRANFGGFSPSRHHKHTPLPSVRQPGLPTWPPPWLHRALGADILLPKTLLGSSQAAVGSRTVWATFPKAEAVRGSVTFRPSSWAGECVLLAFEVYSKIFCIGRVVAHRVRDVTGRKWCRQTCGIIGGPRGRSQAGACHAPVNGRCTLGLIRRLRVRRGHRPCPSCQGLCGCLCDGCRWQGDRGVRFRFGVCSVAQRCGDRRGGRHVGYLGQVWGNGVFVTSVCGPAMGARTLSSSLRS